jgi:DNA mismatch repair protein MutL
MSIRILPNTLINQIAAGEVIERPAAVVRELVENALDAGATQVDVSIRDGGLNFIQVSDNGSGMSADDLNLAVERHATSKLAQEDLLSIKTMGFRGEALPSIGAVSRLTITTRRAEDEHAKNHGWAIFVDGGAKHEVQPASRSVGTTVEVRDLFYATPARLKFMKSAISERMAIVDTMERLALSYPEIGFSLTQENKNLFRVPPKQDFLTRVREIARQEEHLIEIRMQDDDYTLHGILGTPGFTAANATGQFFAVNNRPIRDRNLSGVLRAAYMDVLPRERFPVAFLHFTLPMSSVDMNVHPAKSEVRFRDMSRVKSLIMRSARNILSVPVSSSSVPSIEIRNSLPENRPTGYGAAKPFVSSYSPPRSNNGFAESWALGARHETPMAEEMSAEEKSFPLGTARVQIFNTYIISQTADGLILIDQHAAHERIVYERMKTALADKQIDRQGLLIPEIINVSANEQDLLLNAAPALAELGLGIEAFGPGAVAVNEIPAILGANANLQSMIKDLLSILKDEQDPKQLLERKLFDLCASFACYGSVRAGRSLNVAEMNALLRQMEETDASGQCNHGRPTTIQLTQNDLEKLFARR